MHLDFKHLSIVWIYLILVSCGKSSSDSDSPAASVDFPDSLISEFSGWSPVLNGDLAFASLGHGGQTVRVYFNAIARPYFTGEKTLPFAVDSIVAKAVLNGTSNATKDVAKIYFMKKKAEGFDSKNADWSYAEATGSVGNLSFSKQNGALSACYSCHADEKAWDYVRTVEYYRKQVVSQ